MPYLLDTNAVIALMKQEPGVVERVRQTGLNALYLCAPVEAELWFGVCKSTQQERNRERLRTLLSWLPSLPFSGEAARHCGELRAHLQSAGTPIGPYDLQIAAIARAHGMTLVTRNLREFERVPGLSLENWQAA